MPRTLPPGALGVALRAQQYAEVFSRPSPDVDLFEVIAENFLTPAPLARRNLERAAALAPIVLHGVSLDLLGAAPLRRAWLREVRALADDLDAPWVTDHLCWSRGPDPTAHDGWRSTHDLLPAPRTQATLSWAVDRVRAVQDALGRPFGVENLAAMTSLADDAMPGWAFLAELVDRTGCGVLLDVNNLAVAEHNTGEPADAWLRALAPGQVWEVHVAGQRPAAHGPWVDTHDAPVSEAVWRLYDRAWRALGPFATVLERDDLLPPWDETLAELRHAAQSRGAHPLPAARAPRPSTVAPPSDPTPVATTVPTTAPTPPPELSALQAAWTRALRAPLAWEPPRAHARPERAPDALATLGAADPFHAHERLRAYQEQHGFRLLTAAQHRWPTVARLLGAWTFNQLATALLTAHPPATLDLDDVGADLPTWLPSSPWDAPELREAAAVDAAMRDLFHLPDAPAWAPSPREAAHLAASTLRPSPTLRALRLRWPLPPVREAARAAPDEAAHPCPPPDPATWLLFRTPALDLAQLRAEPALAELLALLERSPVGEAIGALEARYISSHPDLPAKVRAWLDAGVRWGWWSGLTEPSR